MKAIAERKTKKKKFYVCCVDFSSAYNTIDRKILTDRVQQEEILKGWQLDLWKFLLRATKAEIAGIVVSPTTGNRKHTISY